MPTGPLNDNRARSPVPLVPRMRPEELERRIAELRDAADRAGFGNAAFLLDMAAFETRRESEQARRDRAERQADVRDLYLPPSA